MNNRNHYDFTMMNTFQTCRRKYDFRINKGFVGNRSQLAPDFGKSIHKALDCWYEHKDVTETIKVFKEDFVERLEEDDKRTHAMGEWILKNYDAKYKDQPFKVLATETEFEVPLNNGNTLIGRIDKIIEWDDGAVYVMDHKTTSQLGYNYFKTHTPNMQFDGYVHAARHLGYKSVSGVLVDAILVAKGLLQANSRARLTPLARDFAYRSDADIKDYLKQIELIQTDIRLCEDTKEWYPNTGSCTYYGECPYRRVCKEPKEVWDRIIETDYKVDFWDPREVVK